MNRANASVDLDALRITLPAALAWRAITEIARRRHPHHHLHLRQLHPGSSTAGIIQLQLRAHDGRGIHPLELHLGGPQPASWHAADGTGGSLLDLLGRDPSAAIDAIEHAAGLPAWNGARLPPSSPPVRGLRRIAGELERRVFDPRPWRTTAALVGGSEDIVCDWHRHLMPQVTPGPWGEIAAAGRSRLSQLVLVHYAPDEACVTSQSQLQGEGLVVDLADGCSARITAAGVCGRARGA